MKKNTLIGLSCLAIISNNLSGCLRVYLLKHSSVFEELFLFMTIPYVTGWLYSFSIRNLFCFRILEFVDNMKLSRSTPWRKRSSVRLENIRGIWSNPMGSKLR